MILVDSCVNSPVERTPGSHVTLLPILSLLHTVCALLENFTSEAIAELYVTNCSTILLHFTNLYVTYRALQ